MTVSPPPSAPSVLPPHLVPVSLTHVVYDPQDPYGGPLVGKFLAYCSLVPIALLVSYATLILFRRDLATLFMFTGQLVNETVNAVLKKWVKQDRPYPDLLGKGYGWPSSHAQFMTFFTVHLLLSLYTRLTLQNMIWKHLIAVIVIVDCIFVCYSRIHLNYHTVHQVQSGALIGSCAAVIWFTVTTAIILPLFHKWRLLDSTWARFFMLRDTSPMRNVLKMEYEYERGFHRLLLGNNDKNNNSSSSVKSKRK